MKTKMGAVIVVLAIAALLVIAILGAAPGIVPFKPISRQAILGTLSWLFVVALFIERAVEVIVSTLRDAEAATLQQKVDAEQEKVDAQAKLTPSALPYLTQLHAAQQRLIDYRSDTKELALCVSFILSLFVSLAGVRAFGSIMMPPSPATWFFAAADVIVTGAVLAGGTDAIHQMMNVVTNFLGNAADKAGGS